MTPHEFDVLLDFAAANARTSGDSESCTCISCEAARIVDAPRRAHVLKHEGKWWTWAISGRGEPLYLLDRFGSGSHRDAIATASRHIKRSRKEAQR